MVSFRLSLWLLASHTTVSLLLYHNMLPRFAFTSMQRLLRPPTRATQNLTLSKPTNLIGDITSHHFHSRVFKIKMPGTRANEKVQAYAGVFLVTAYLKERHKPFDLSRKHLVCSRCLRR
ncbi:hypothetical protein NPIL_659921 [Nephila pilipes]|uniref:Uncharacterized protein n=1 Tax=Nephila pilipes TaxID=299642 RepID=A0A8X6N7W3_NEPPI|nr:hypothetical protein NPIL_659921 [Nephila pilipes]